MEHFTRTFISLSIFLIIAVSMTGCSDNTDSTASGSPSGTVAATTTAGPLYTAGDIVRSASGSESPAWLVVSYDPAGDSYTRALIYKNPDGSYGYRTNSATTTLQRAAMEKVYTVKIRHVDVASVPTAAPTTVTTVVTTATTSTTTAATATTTASGDRPSIKATDPEEGEAGTTVTMEITGSNFVSGMKAKLQHEGETSIAATTVDWYSKSSATCTFDISNRTKVGTWDIVVTNPDGQSGDIKNYFMVRGNETEE
jgi:hypothetical protein